MRKLFTLAALAAAAAAASPAAAQSAPVVASDQAEARGVILQPLTLTRIQDLDFGTVIGSPSVAGTVTIDPDTGNRSTSGGVSGHPGYLGDRGLFGGAGTAAQTVELTLNAPTVLVHSASPTTFLAVDEIVLDNGNATTRTIDATSAFFVGVGGTFNIAAGQTPGLYSAQFELTAEYQ
jgi:hypothetical protein